MIILPNFLAPRTTLLDVNHRPHFLFVNLVPLVTAPDLFPPFGYRIPHFKGLIPCTVILYMFPVGVILVI